eukprot:CAMPEP_0119033482 /NCGR_PEP_ID=MMETSP1177-20130426/523_1 /TAXON_ID=2985 /ORGANISM="Ochromonas sp, Strain CCMP1899" /LENGTH=329 /DNA_ID=CAMNT_0006990255 /DNA_START=180 /DNA_END=1169 /DNA_ORIENTATION=+
MSSVAAPNKPMNNIWNRIMFTIGMNKRVRTDKELKDGIANFYDESSQVWLDVWGEHMHHGYYPSPDYEEHQLAQVDMIDRSLAWAYGNDLLKDDFMEPKTMVDVGCGVGGSSRFISKKWGTKGKGISLSPFQIGKAKEITKIQGLEGKVDYQVADAMKMPFDDNSFDLTWSMESGEHMPDKKDFVNELFRVTVPGGRIIIVTWCHRELLDGETKLKDKEYRLLDKINDAYFLPEWAPASTYVRVAKDLGLEDVRQADWSTFIAPFWGAVFKSALKPRNFFRMLQSGFTTFKGFVATLWMLRGFQQGVIKFALITGRKAKMPESKPQPAI